MIAILGPTACGKTKYAVRLAAELDAEIISADSRQVFRGMDIGTGKDLNEYTFNDKKIPYHLIDIRNPGEIYSVFDFLKDFEKAYNDIRQRGKEVVLCGGTGLYLSAVIQGYRMKEVPVDAQFHEAMNDLPHETLIEQLKALTQTHNQTDFTDKARTIRALEIALSEQNQNKKATPKWPVEKIIGLAPDRTIIRGRITKRLQERLNNGMIEEVENLINNGIKPEQLLFYGLEYKYITLYLQQQLSYDQMFNQLNTAIHQFAKRQMTWFRRMEKQGVEISWNPIDYKY